MIFRVPLNPDHSMIPLRTGIAWWLCGNMVQNNTVLNFWFSLVFCLLLCLCTGLGLSGKLKLNGRMLTQSTCCLHQGWRAAQVMQNPTTSSYYHISLFLPLNSDSTEMLMQCTQARKRKEVQKVKQFLSSCPGKM